MPPSLQACLSLPPHCRPGVEISAADVQIEQRFQTLEETHSLCTSLPPRILKSCCPRLQGSSGWGERWAFPEEQSHFWPWKVGLSCEKVALFPESGDSPSTDFWSSSGTTSADHSWAFTELVLLGLLPPTAVFLLGALCVACRDPQPHLPPGPPPVL